MPKLRVDVYNPHPNQSALMANAVAAPDLSSLTGVLIPGAIMGDGIGTPTPGPRADTLVGTDKDDMIYAGLLGDLVRGGGGNDFIEAGQGDDVVYGGAGDDRVFGGSDFERVETNELRGEDGHDLIMGGNGIDFLVGDAGNDTLKGGERDDVLYGGDGNDSFVGGTGDDVLDGGAGYDWVDLTSVSIGAWVDLRDTGRQATGEGYDSFVSIEAVITGDGNDLLIGNKDGNTLIASAGNDTLAGGYGTDALWGFEGKDRFVFDARLNKRANVDWLYDFNRREGDKIALDNDIFKALGKAGKLKKGFFKVGSKAKDANDHILYNKAVKALAYDPDGDGRKAAVMFAKFDKAVSLTYADFVVIG
jgi:Ca2+-binding RTX toxin-like protein